MTVADLDPGEPAVEGTRRVLADLAATIAELIERLPFHEPEAIHDLRVALRRSRAVVAAARGVLPDGERREARARLRSLAASTTPARDLEVLVAELDRHGAEVAGVDRAALEVVRGELARRLDQATALAAAALQDPHARSWLQGWHRWLTDPSPTGEASGRLGPAVADQLHRAERTVLRHGRAIGSRSSPEDLHELRKEAKSLRYLIEAYRPLLPHGQAKALGAGLRDLQEVLGAHHDAVTQVHQLAELAGSLTRTGAPGISAQATLERLRADAARRIDLQRAAVAPCFARYDAKERRRSFTRVLDQLRTGRR